MKLILKLIFRNQKILQSFHCTFKQRRMKTRSFPVFSMISKMLYLIWILLWWSAPAFGLQAHATSEEGLYSHQLGHLFFILSMVVFAFWLKKTRLVKKKGWRLIQVSCFFFILWNLDAIAGHQVELWISESRFIGPPSSKVLPLAWQSPQLSAAEDMANPFS